MLYIIFLTNKINFCIALTIRFVYSADRFFGKQEKNSARPRNSGIVFRHYRQIGILKIFFQMNTF